MPTVENYEHNAATRTNIPREETRDFVSKDEKAPVMMRYPRDPSLDPQLVWQGKDEQDGYDLTVPAVPIYIQEEISPRALIADLYDKSRGESDQPHLFPVNVSSTLDQTVGFYQHDETWRNRLILGDSLLVMTSLAEKEGLRGKVQTIYIDPPYGIKFGSNWQVSTRKRDVKDGKLEDATREPEQVRAFRDTWEKGIHSYLSYLRDRLMIARELLTESGSIFVQIGDENVHMVRSLLDEIFGSENFCSLIPFRKTGGLRSTLLDSVFDFLLWYATDTGRVKYRQLYGDKEPGEAGARAYKYLVRDHKIVSVDPSNVPPGERLCTHGDCTSQGNEISSYQFQGKTFTGGFKYKNPEGMDALARAGRLAWFGNTLRVVRYLDDFQSFPINQNWSDTGVSGFASDKRYVVETSTKVV
jgi:adenine-specific DNA-methyltransferase